MLQNSNMQERKLLEFSEMLGLNKGDVDQILSNGSNTNEQMVYSFGPYDPPYWATYYGTISIKDF